MAPDSAVTPAAAPPPPPQLTDEQAHAVVTIKGDNAQGAGFLVHTADGFFVVTHLHLLAANPNLQIIASNGTVITTLSLKGAVDRDLAMFAIKDDHYNYLPVATGSVDTGDTVIIPDIGGGMRYFPVSREMWSASARSGSTSITRWAGAAKALP